MTLNEDQQRQVQGAALTMQIIAGALLMGVITFLAVVLLVIPAGDQENQQLLQTYLAVGFACVALPAAFLVPRFLGTPVTQDLVDGDKTRGQGRDSTPSDLGEELPPIGLYQTRMIIGLAILEGAAFFNVTAYMIERQPVNLVMTGVLLAAMALKFPSRGRLENWLEEESRRIRDERSLRG